MSENDWQRDSDMVFTAISTGDFDDYKMAEQAVVTIYVPDMSVSRAGMSDALKRLERFYAERSHAEGMERMLQKIDELTDEAMRPGGLGRVAQALGGDLIVHHTHIDRDASGRCAVMKAIAKKVLPDEWCWDVVSRADGSCEVIVMRTT